METSINNNNNNNNELVQQEHQPEASDKRVYTSMAHVFEIDPVTRQSWSPKSNEAVPVSLVMDLRQKILSLIGSDPKLQETIINSIILPKTVFTRTSLKFGQWSDGVTSTVYGLGFATENELNKFVSKFGEFKKLLPIVTPSSSSSYSGSHQQQSQPHTSILGSSTSWANNSSNQHAHNASAANESSTDINQVCNDLASAHLGSHSNNQPSHTNNEQQQTAANVINGNNNINNIALDSNGNNSMISDAGPEGPDIANNNAIGSHHRSQSLSGIRARMNSSSSIGSDQQQQEQHNNTIGHSVKQPSSHSATGGITKSSNNNNYSPLSNRESQLECENDRLKLALAAINTEYNANKKKWSLEIQKLKSNIYKLTDALRESNNNRNEWEQLLSKLRSENAEYKIRILGFEASNGDPEAKAGFQERYDRLNHELEKNQNELKKKEYEISVLREELQQEKNSNKVNNNIGSQDISRQFEVVYTKIGSKVRELGEIHHEFGLLLESK